MNKKPAWASPYSPISPEETQVASPLAEEADAKAELTELLGYLTRQYNPFDEELNLPLNEHYRWEWVGTHPLDWAKFLFQVVEGELLRSPSQEQSFALQQEATLVLSDWAASDEKGWLELVEHQLKENPSEGSLALILGAASHYVSADTLTRTLAAPVVTAVWPLRRNLSQDNWELLAELLAACEPYVAHEKLSQLKEIMQERLA